MFGKPPQFSPTGEDSTKAKDQAPTTFGAQPAPLANQPSGFGSQSGTFNFNSLVAQANAGSQPMFAPPTQSLFGAPSNQGGPSWINEVKSQFRNE